jgi:hypothetical protein
MAPQRFERSGPGRKRERSAAMGIVRQSALMVAAALVGCGGAAFEQGSPAGSDLAGAAGAAGAVSIGTGGSSMPAGGHAGSSAGGSKANGATSSSDAGEGGADEAPGGAGGSSAGGSSAGGSSAGGSSAGGSSAGGSSAGGLPSCLSGWQGSPCDTCTRSSAAPGSETCAELLACYIEKGTGNCDYVKPTADAVVQVAHDVLECRCH